MTMSTIKSVHNRLASNNDLSPRNLLQQSSLIEPRTPSKAVTRPTLSRNSSYDENDKALAFGSLPLASSPETHCALNLTETLYASPRSSQRRNSIQSPFTEHRFQERSLSPSVARSLLIFFAVAILAISGSVNVLTTSHSKKIDQRVATMDELSFEMRNMARQLGHLEVMEKEIISKIQPSVVRAEGQEQKRSQEEDKNRLADMLVNKIDELEKLKEESTKVLEHEKEFEIREKTHLGKEKAFFDKYSNQMKTSADLRVRLQNQQKELVHLRKAVANKEESNEERKKLRGLKNYDQTSEIEDLKAEIAALHAEISRGP